MPYIDFQLLFKLVIDSSRTKSNKNLFKNVTKGWHVCCILSKGKMLKCSPFDFVLCRIIKKGSTFTRILSYSGCRVSMHCLVLILRWVDAPCCQSAGCPRRASCTGSSPRRATSGALAWSSGRSSPTANSPGTSSPTVRWVGTECYSAAKVLLFIGT